MAELFLRFNTETKSVLGAHLDGKWLSGVAEVTLTKGGLAVLDAHGRHLLDSGGKPVVHDRPEPIEKQVAGFLTEPSDPPAEHAQVAGTLSKRDADIAAFIESFGRGDH